MSRRAACRLLLGWLLPVIIVVPVLGQNNDIHQLARAVDDHYNHLRSLQSDFTEIYQGDGPERVESGTLWLKKPRKMRWEYRSPKEKLFVSDGQSVWFYLPAERQLRKTSLKKLDDLRSPMAFLLGKTKLENELRGLSKAVDQSPMIAGDTVLRGVPQSVDGGTGKRGAAGDLALESDCPHRTDWTRTGRRRSSGLRAGKRTWS